MLKRVFPFILTSIALQQAQGQTTSHRAIHTLLKTMTIDEKINQLSTVFGWEMYSKQANKIGVSSKFANYSYKPGMLWGTLRADPWTKVTLKTGLNYTESVEATNALQKASIESSPSRIPILLAEEGAHGVMAIGTTVFPTAIGQASTFDTSLIRKMGEAIAVETRALGSHVVYGPILDLARELRWSRVEETFGEDPELVSQMGVAMVRGLQDGPTKTIATLKHFAAYGMSDGGQNGGPTTLGKRDLIENILYPFRNAVKAGAGSVMSSYNSIDGVPCSGDSWLMNTVLRKEWGFSGFTVSDLGSIDGLYSTHQVAPTAEAGAALALKSGMDTDLGGNGFGKNLKKAFEQKLVTVAEIDTAVMRLLRAKQRLGLFKNPYNDTKKVNQLVHQSTFVDLAKQLAQSSIILLKNDTVAGKPLLPLSSNIKRLVVIGPNANNIYNQLGDYTAPQDSAKIITVLKGLKNRLPNTDIQYVKGCTIRDSSFNEITQAVNTAKNSDAVVVVLGGSSARDFKTEYKETGAATVSEADGKEPMSDMESGEGYDRTTLELMGLQQDLLKQLAATGKPIVLVLIEGRPLNINWASENIPSIINAWYPGEQGGNAIADVLVGNYNPAGRLPVSIPRSVGQLPVFYNYKKPIKHRYVEEEATPLYSFGYGLSYTHFKYENLQLHSSKLNGKVSVKASFTITNDGPLDGDEVPQLYIRQQYTSVVRPIKQLRAFSRIFLKVGESKTVTFSLSEKQLATWGKEEKWSMEPGKYQIQIGKSSDNIVLQSSIEL
ncbi:MAG: beta-glucosidase [Pseudopedobacter saltans]|uniref:Beta-glucosidase n=1 Tax=Pseudopedobacter saltans TaxID=151895 RepID=A0A2W5F9E9_9SPHI|nr:MAG: beta-glucosidase [Pseudopedobacter saltans]